RPRQHLRAGRGHGPRGGAGGVRVPPRHGADRGPVRRRPGGPRRPRDDPSARGRARPDAPSPRGRLLDERGRRAVRSGDAGERGGLRAAHAGTGLCRSGSRGPDLRGRAAPHRLPRVGRGPPAGGRGEVTPNTVNVVPGAVRLSTDLRARSGEVLDAAVRRLAALCETVAQRDGVHIRATEFWRSPPTPFDPLVVDAVAETARGLEYSTHRLWAGAGHDAKYVADRYPAGMIFVPSAGGLSHNEAEWTPKDDCVRGATV